MLAEAGGYRNKADRVRRHGAAAGAGRVERFTPVSGFAITGLELETDYRASSSGDSTKG
jgi:hypothetical protein